MDERTARTGEKVVRHTYYIRSDQVDWLRITAAKERADASRLVRQAIDEFKSGRKPKKKR